MCGLCGEEFMQLKKFDYKKYDNKKIVLYGTAQMQYIATKCLENVGISVNCYVNRDGKYYSPFYNISACAFLESSDLDDIIIILATHIEVRSHIQLLNKMGVEIVYSLRDLLNECDFINYDVPDVYKNIYNECEKVWFFEDSAFHPEWLMIKSIDAMVTERCSLKCKGCSNLMQYYENPVNTDIERLRGSIDRLLKRVDKLYALRILGGEPFMNCEFTKLIDYYGDCEKITSIEIYSNATIFPSSTILEKLKNNKIEMIFSDYDELSIKLAEWIDWCKGNSVKYHVIRMDVWQDCGRLQRHDYTTEMLKGLYSSCECRNTPTIIGNRLFNCAYAANAANLGAIYDDEVDRDSLVIDDEITKEKIDMFLHDRDYLEACRYCKGRNASRARIAPHIQTERTLEYIKLSGCKHDIQINQHIQKKQDDDYMVSIVVPVYNVEEFLERCLKSIVNQTYTNLEIIIVDDGSDDGSLKICKKYHADTRVKILELNHQGVAIARKEGIQEATGELIAFVDADDYIDCDYIENMVCKIGDSDLISSGNWKENVYRTVSDLSMDRGQSARTLIKPDMPEGLYEGEDLEKILRFMFSNSVYTIRRVVWGRLFRTDILKKVCRNLDYRIWMGEDRVLFQTYILNCKKVSYIDEFGYHYCIRPVEDRYPWEKSFENSDIIKRIMLKEVKGHPCEVMLRQGILDDYISFNRMALDILEGKEHYYYPYYGRIKGKRVILYGAGRVGESYYKNLIKDESVIFVEWVDNDAENIKKTRMLPVKPVAELMRLEFDLIIVAVYSEELYETIVAELCDMGIQKELMLWQPTKVLDWTR